MEIKKFEVLKNEQRESFTIEMISNERTEENNNKTNNLTWSNLVVKLPEKRSCFNCSKKSHPRADIEYEGKGNFDRENFDIF